MKKEFIKKESIRSVISSIAALVVAFIASIVTTSFILPIVVAVVVFFIVYFFLKVQIIVEVKKEEAEVAEAKTPEGLIKKFSEQITRISNLINGCSNSEIRTQLSASVETLKNILDFICKEPKEILRFNRAIQVDYQLDTLFEVISRYQEIDKYKMFDSIEEIVDYLKKFNSGFRSAFKGLLDHKVLDVNTDMRVAVASIKLKMEIPD